MSTRIGSYQILVNREISQKRVQNNRRGFSVRAAGSEVNLLKEYMY